ncbi:MAG: hypothetical protein ACYSWP_04000 [Planctomycetota bacterium]
MRKQATNKSVVNNGVLSRLTADKKKAVAALCLIGLMVFMWVRVLTRKPEGAEAGTSTPVINDSVSDPEAILKVSFVDLPSIEGRHDVLARDFFASNNWRDFLSDKNSGVISVSNGSDELARRIAATLQLNAIIAGSEGRNQVSINYALYSVGETIEIKQGEEVYKCEVIEIGDNRVLMRFRETQIELKLIQTNES